MEELPPKQSMFVFSSLQVNPELNADYWDIHKLIKYLKVSSNVPIFEFFS